MVIAYRFDTRVLRACQYIRLEKRKARAMQHTDTLSQH